MKKLTGIIIIALLTFGIQAYSQPADGRDYDRIIKRLKLTDEQKKDVNKIKVDMKKQLIDQKAKLQKARLELQEIFKVDSPDKSAIEKKLNEIADLEVQARMIKVDSWFAVNKLSTPEQQKIWKKALTDRPAMKHKMMNRDENRPMMKKEGKERMQKREEIKKQD